MPQNGDAVSKALASAKSALSHANTAFPSPAKPAVAPAKPAAAPKPATLGDELVAKKTMVDKAVSALPKMHTGGPVIKDGAYQLKAGEHVLTAPEAEKARKHALMSVGMKSLAKTMPKTAGQPAKMNVKQKVSEKTQSAKIVDKTKK